MSEISYEDTKGNSVGESARQAVIVMKNEIKKFFSGKRMLVYGVLLGIIIFILAILPPLLGKESSTVYFYSLASLVVLIASTLFASISIVSEYEERTALIIFTRPIRKVSIFMGKALASYVISIAFLMLYYLVAAFVLIGTCGGDIMSVKFSDAIVDLFASFGYACVYAFATTGIAMAISAFMKKASTATIITFVVLAVIFLALSTVLSIAKIDVTWLLDQASASIATATAEYRDYMNGMMNEILKIISYPTVFVNFDNFSAVLGAMGITISPDMLEYIMSNPDTEIWNAARFQEYIGKSFVSAPNGPRDVLFMLLWGVGGFVVAFWRFLRREF